MTRALASALAFGLAASAACAPATDEPVECELGVTSLAVGPADRAILGAGAAYAADGTLRARDDELRRSQRARREVAWQTAAKVLEPVALAEPLPSAPAEAAYVPAWQTWYGEDDVRRVFHRLYTALDADARARRDRFTDAALDEAFGWNTRAVLELDSWPEERWQAYLDAIEDAEEARGIAGVAPVGYSPAAARHLITSYPEILQCLASGTPPALAEGPGAGERELVREPIALDGCAARRVGPVFVASGETLAATFEGDGAAGATITITAGDTDAACEAIGEPCAVEGPGTFTVTIASDGRGADGVLSLDYTEPRPTWAACLESAFPLDAVVVKAAWRRADIGAPLATYDTSAAALSRRLAGDASWETPDATADPRPEDIYTIRLPGGATYRLAGLHIMTKELDHWLWTTLWWSPAPNTDFGADRPASLDGVWENYKMCTATAFAELDPDPTAGFAESAPTLADALSAIHEGQGAPTWCSNPYLEAGHGNADTNCIGCHQHAGTGQLAEDILAAPTHGRTQLRNNFPSDYSWAVDAGDRLGLTFAEIVDYYD